MKHISLYSLLLLLLFSCSKYETQFEGPYSEEDNDVITEFNEFLIIQSNKIKLIDRVKKELKLVPTDESVSKAAFNYSRDKIAYQGSGNIKIIDIYGNFIAEIPGSQEAKYFEWHANNETLYYLLSNDIIMYYGPEIQIANTHLSNIFPPNTAAREVTSVGICPDGTVIAGIRYKINGNYTRAINIDYPESSGLTDYSESDFDSYFIDQIKIDTAGQFFSFTTKSSNGNDYYGYTGEIGGSINSVNIYDILLIAISPSGKRFAYIEEGYEYNFHIKDMLYVFSGNFEYQATIEGATAMALDW